MTTSNPDSVDPADQKRIDDKIKHLSDDIERLKLDPEEARLKEELIRAEFEKKYGKVGGALLLSKFKIVRDLAINVLSLYEMLIDPDYTIPWPVKVATITAIGYFISPIDVIPDAIPVAGFVDDALVVAYVVHLLRDDITKYRTWRKEQGRPLPES